MLIQALVNFILMNQVFYKILNKYKKKVEVIILIMNKRNNICMIHNMTKKQKIYWIEKNKKIIFKENAIFAFMNMN